MLDESETTLQKTVLTMCLAERSLMHFKGLQDSLYLFNISQVVLMCIVSNDKMTSYH